MKRVEEILVDYEGRRISCTLYDPVNRPHNKAILFIHGGGFVVGSPKTHDGIQRRLAHLTKAVVLSMDYSLAPEVKFPVQIYECAAVLQHLKDHGIEYGIDSGNISLSGDSAGAYLSLATAVYLRDRGESDAIRSLLLFYGSYGLYFIFQIFFGNLNDFRRTDQKKLVIFMELQLRAWCENELFVPSYTNDGSSCFLEEFAF